MVVVVLVGFVAGLFFLSFWFLLLWGFFMQINKNSFEEYSVEKNVFGISMMLFEVFDMLSKLKTIHLDYQASSSFAERH